MQGDWTDTEKYLVEQMNTLSRKVDDHHKEAMQEIKTIAGDILAMKAKSSVWGAIWGFIAALGASVAMTILGKYVR